MLVGINGSYNCGTRKARALALVQLLTSIAAQIHNMLLFVMVRRLSGMYLMYILAEATINLPWGDEITYNAKTT